VSKEMLNRSSWVARARRIQHDGWTRVLQEQSSTTTAFYSSFLIEMGLGLEKAHKDHQD
jgi:hypothetical protein